VMNVTKAASPFSLAASKADSIRPPTPRSISATEIVSADATPKGEPLCCVICLATDPNADDDEADETTERTCCCLDGNDVEKARVVDDAIEQANPITERDVKRIIQRLCLSCF
jgi:hypothetical protein